MKINFGLLSLVTAQSGDFEDSSYDYDAPTDRWSNSNEWSLDNANAGITFGVMARVTKQQNAKHFQKALKLSCWNSNMVRDMNNDNKFAPYFLDQVEYKRFFPGMGTGTNGFSGVGGTVDNTDGADDLSWLYAVGDLRTGYHHQYGFEHSDSAPYYISDSGAGSTDVDRMGHATGTGSDDGRSGKNNNRLRQLDEIDYKQAYTASEEVGNSGSKTIIGSSGDNTEAGIRVDDPYHSLRPNNKWTHRKWGYQSDNVERKASYGYAEDTVVYHFGHHDNMNNGANRPNMRYAASNEGEDTLTTNYNSDPTNADNKNALNMHQEEYDFHGFKDDWRYSLRMGGCLYEAARWVYDESSFHRTSRLTYTDDTLFMDDPFNPMDGTDIFGAHSKGNIHGTALVANSITDVPTALKAEQDAKAAYEAFVINPTCTDTPNTYTNDAAGCKAHMLELGRLWMEMNFCLYQAAQDATSCAGDITAYQNYRANLYEDNDIGFVPQNAPPYLTPGVDTSTPEHYGCTIDQDIPILTTCCMNATCYETCYDTCYNTCYDDDGDPYSCGAGFDCRPHDCRPYTCCGDTNCFTDNYAAAASANCGYLGGNDVGQRRVDYTEPTNAHGIEKTHYADINAFLGVFSFLIFRMDIKNILKTISCKVYNFYHLEN